MIFPEEAKESVLKILWRFSNLDPLVFTNLSDLRDNDAGRKREEGRKGLRTPPEDGRREKNSSAIPARIMTCPRFRHGCPRAVAVVHGRMVSTRF